MVKISNLEQYVATFVFFPNGQVPNPFPNWTQKGQKISVLPIKNSDQTVQTVCLA